MNGNKMRTRSWLALLMSLVLLAFLSFHNAVASGEQSGQSGSIVTSIKLKRIQLIASTVATDGQTKKCSYTLSESPNILLSLVNQTGQEIPSREFHDRFSQYRFDLRRDGALIEPRPEITKRLKSKAAAEEGWEGVTVFDPVKPYRTATVALIKLDDWYGQLTTGSYHLTVKYLIANSKELEIAASTDFYVVP